LLGAVQLSAQDSEILGKQVLVITNYGAFTVLLYDKTPQHRDNFLKLVNDGFYNDLLFHRVIKNFMVQGGDPDSKSATDDATLGQGGPGYTIPSEFFPGFYHKKGALAAARQGDKVNPEKRSSGSQFYVVDGKTYEQADLDRLIERKRLAYYRNEMGVYLSDSSNVDDLERFKALRTAQDNDGLNSFNKELEAKIDKLHGGPPEYSYTDEQINTYAAIGGAPHLDGDYTVFGEVIDGIEVVEAISGMATDSHSRPIENIIMTMRVIN